MGRALRDQNYVPTLLGVSSLDTETPTLIAVDPSTNRLLVNTTQTVGGITPSMHFDADGDNTAQVIKASDGYLFFLEVQNPTSSDAYIQLFNTASGSVTVGTTTPVLSFLVPAGDGTKDGAMDKIFSTPLYFDTAITYACTTTVAGSGDPATGLIVNASYL